jgi:hypothetical protein
MLDIVCGINFQYMVQPSSGRYTVKLVQGGMARDRIYFPNWTIFRIIRNCKKKKTAENQLKYCMVYSTGL